MTLRKLLVPVWVLLAVASGLVLSVGALLWVSAAGLDDYIRWG